ncbi:MAG: hypothetical protein PHT07_15385 [Paludibacter sp.]|nr:hypothetical protein [Paludibacter sp.]
MKKESTFKVQNDTHKWAIIVDGKCQLFNSKGEANKIYNKIGDIENSPFGSVNMVPPGYVYKDYLGSIHKDAVKISKIRRINIVKHLHQQKKRVSKRVTKNDSKMKSDLDRFIDSISIFK